MSESYKQAGVDIDAGEALVAKIKPFVEATHGKEVRGNYGGYGALFAIDAIDSQRNLLVTGTDGVGTKLELTKETGYWDRIGQDLVAMCANDILCLGARPLFFLDYYATGELEVDSTARIIKGIAAACQTIGCALVGGETAEMPGVYKPGDFDMAGFIVGVVAADRVLDGSRIQPGDRVLGLASSGFHSNGYSLIRHIIAQQQLDLETKAPGEDATLSDLLTRPTRLYGPIIAPLLDADLCHGLAHITGGGLIGNIPRILPDECRLQLDRSRWERPQHFDFFQELGSLSAQDMVRVFNDGIGLVVITGAEQGDTVSNQLTSCGESVWDLGTIEAREAGQEAVELI